MGKQRLNHIRKLDNMGEERRSAVEIERLHSVPTAKQRKYFRALCAKIRENRLEPPMQNPFDRITYNVAISEALKVLSDAGIEVMSYDAQVEHHIMPGYGIRPGDITRERTTVIGGKYKRPQKVYNRNGLVPRSEKGGN